MEDIMASPTGINATARALNSSMSFLPSPRDLMMALPRMVGRAGHLIQEGIESFEGVFHAALGQRTIPEVTRAGIQGVVTSMGNDAGPAARAAGTGAGATANLPATGFLTYVPHFDLSHLRTFSGIFSYLTSRWALACVAAAIVLNRTAVFASARRHIHLKWQARLALRVVPILLLGTQLLSSLRGMRCQTSPSFGLMRYGEADKMISLDFSQDGGFLYGLSSGLLFAETDQDSCQAINMIRTTEEDEAPRGSLGLLWPVFGTLCFSKWVETLSCAVQGLPVATEVGMSLFEHSLAYAESEAMIANVIGLGPFSKHNASEKIASRKITSDPSMSSRAQILSRFNTPPEVLLVTVISICNSLTSHGLGVLGLQSRYRLLNTGLWGMCFLGSFAWALYNFSVDQVLDSGIFRFPTVCVVGFIPHLLVVSGVLMCAFIYVVALTLSAVSPPDASPASTWKERFQRAYNNMQTNAQLATLHINMREDFYTAILRVGFSGLTAASDAVFLNEGRHVNVGQLTWLEEERLNDMERSRHRTTATGALQSSEDASFSSVANGIIFAESERSLLSPQEWKSGYARERTTKMVKGQGNNHGDGVGTFQRGGRYLLALDFLTKIFWLLVGWNVLALNKFFTSVGVTYRPVWMRKVLHGTTGPEPERKLPAPKSNKSLDFWILTDDGELALPKDDDVDVEAETKKRLRMAASSWGKEQEEHLDTSLYNWFTSNGWWGEQDTSGEWMNSPMNDGDTTSVISDAETDTEDDWESDNDGRRTPTRQHPTWGVPDPESDPDIALSASDLARLLNPQDAEARYEAKIMAQHLRSERIVTRSQFEHNQGDQGSRLLVSSRHRPPGFKASRADGRLEPSEEAEILEFLILRFRGEKGPAAAAGDARDGSAFSGGPQCVVCQSEPRTVLAWPCRCLSLCEDCRVSLAMNNFGSCVCCRQEVVGFSRLFVP